MLRAITIVLLSAASAVYGADLRPPAAFIDCDVELLRRFGADLVGRPAEDVSAAIVELAESLPQGGAIRLPESLPCGVLDFRRVADDVQITGGRDGTIVFGGAPHGQAGLQLLFSRLDQRIAPGLRRAPDKLRAASGLIAHGEMRLFDKEARPASGLLAMFCEGGLHITADVKDCAWIAGANAFGKKSVTASARVDDSLFLWFGINWPFADYNGHLDPKNAKRNWLDNAQMHFDLKGGGAGTRLYLMVETNYGNPGPGVILENCKGLAAYHGSTERASSQGPGIYWLRNCEDVKLGLRRTFSATRGGPRGARPAHDITVEGGRGNVLHDIEFFGNAQAESVVSTDPALQLWSVSTDFENKGLEGAGVLRFAYTPNLNKPEGAELEAIRAKLPKLVDDGLKTLRLEDTADNRRRLEAFFLSGRDAWNRLNAREEVAFDFGGVDLTKDGAKPAGKLPAPPSMPATNAPRLRAPIAFTQQPDFGRELLAAGADPTGAKPSDDAFAKLMFGMTRDQVQAVLEETYKADADFRDARAKKDDEAMKAARARLDAAYRKLHPEEPGAAGKGGKGGKPGRVKRRTIEVPAGTFLLARPLVLTGGWSTLWGAGPDKTVLKAGGDIKVIEQHEKGDVCNLAIDGGRVGLAFTGADHADPVSPTLHAYVAGRNYWNITFRNQTFAGIHVGNDDPEMMGGAEHDQNKYVDLKFVNTGRYGIFMNQNMLDKWLLLHSEFSGQTAAGVSIKFNNLIHGGVIGCTFRDIAGPGLDFMGGNPEIRFRTHQVLVDQCDFTECGSGSAPAVDQGAGVCMSFTRCRIVTHGKTVKAGYAGGAQIYEDVSVDVKTAAGAPAVLLRAVRNNQTGRPNGHTLRGFRSTGGLAFLNDANAHNALFAKTCKAKGIDPNLNWDCNPAGHELAPAGGWVHPFVLYDCEFAGRRYPYSLLNVDTDAGKVLREIDLKRFAE